MNQLDPGGSWTLQNDQIILGGNQTKSYGPISISNVLGSSLVLTPEYKIRNLQTALSLGTGIHALQFNQKEKACSDSVLVTVTCTGCPTFHNYQPDSLGVIIVTADTCNGEFPFCTTILNKINIINQYDISVDNVYNPTLSACGTLLALPLDTGLHVISIREKATNCINNLKVKVKCPPPGIGDLKANPDNFISPLATEIELPILNNDVVFGVLGNKAGLVSVQTIVAPKLGGVTYFPNEGIFKYFPENGCGQDTFSYALRDTIGRESITQVAVKVYCDKLFVFNGISPNGDQLNDVWHIIGIESFPGNEVSVYNRWGALVFKQQGYNNQSAWDGQSNGKTLPDGTYFYIIDLGNGETSVKGYLQIMH
jgi:gliding motility-associated-like protein